MKKLLLLSVSLPTLMVAAPALAQDGGQQEADVLTVIGSRVAGRTALQSNVPVDVIQADELAATPSIDLKDAMRQVSPSFTVERNAIADGASFQREVALRGLDGGSVIVLLNGKRVHRNAILVGTGYQAADLGTFTVNSLKNVSVLRDGAAAQYGADAIAGVINLTMDDSEGIEGYARYSKYYEGDGAGYTVASKVGLNLADRGFLVITGSYADQNLTNRADPHLVAAAAVRNFGDPVDPTTIRELGIPARTNVNFTWNAAMEVNENVEVYTFGNYAAANIDETFNYRNRRGTLPGDLRNGQIQGASSNFKNTAFTVQRLQDLFGQVRGSELASLAIDGGNGGIDFGQVHPGGFTPDFLVFGQDIGAYAGIRGEFDNGLTWDLSGSIGRNRVDYDTNNTLNPSLGAPIDFSRPGISTLTAGELAALPLNFANDPMGVPFTNADFGALDYDNVQTDFYAGSLVNIERSISLDLGYEIETDAVDSLNVFAGYERRTEQYYNVVGELNSFSVGPLSDLNVGANGFQGIDPGQAFDVNRSSNAFYMEIDANIIDGLNVSAAGRYEDFSDFGDNFSWKVAGRWQAVPDTLAIRAAASTGFHAPSIGQISSINSFTGFNAQTNQTTIIGTVPASSDVGAILGATPLGPEKARNLSAGVIITPGDNTNITLDVFQITLDDRIRRSRNFRTANDGTGGSPNDAPLFQQIIDLGTVLGAESFTTFRFLENSMDTRTRGIELVATHNVEFDNSNLRLTLAASHIDTEVQRFNPVTTNLNSIHQVENETEPYRATFTGVYAFDDFSFMGRARWYSGRDRDGNFDSVTGQPRGGSDLNQRIDRIDGVVFFDASITYDVNEQFELIVGADNLFNKFPQENRDLIQLSNANGARYVTPGPDWQGGSYYVSVKARF